MQTVTVGTKNQIVIPLEVRKKISELKPGKQLSVYAVDSETIGIRVSKNDWIKRSIGILKRLGKNKSWSQKIELMRDQWHEN